MVGRRYVQGSVEVERLATKQRPARLGLGSKRKAELCGNIGASDGLDKVEGTC